MFEDTIVAEIRTIRERHARLFNCNVREIAADLKKKQDQSGRKTVSYPPKPSRLKKSA
jgi:hypothetical protein